MIDLFILKVDVQFINNCSEIKSEHRYCWWDILS